MGAEGSTGRCGRCHAGRVHTNRIQASAVGLALGAVLSLPALVVLALVTGDVAETAAAWPYVAAPLLLIGAALGAVAGGRRTPVHVPVEARTYREPPAP